MIKVQLTANQCYSDEIEVVLIIPGIGEYLLDCADEHAEDITQEQYTAFARK